MIQSYWGSETEKKIIYVLVASILLFSPSRQLCDNKAEKITDLLIMITPVFRLSQDDKFLIVTSKFRKFY